METDPARQNLNLGPLEVSFVGYGNFGGHVLAVFVSWLCHEVIAMHTNVFGYVLRLT